MLITQESQKTPENRAITRIYRMSVCHSVDSHGSPLFVRLIGRCRNTESMREKKRINTCDLIYRAFSSRATRMSVGARHANSIHQRSRRRKIAFQAEGLDNSVFREKDDLR